MVAAGAYPRADVSAAWCVGQPVPAGHAPDQVRCVGAGYPAAATNSGRPEDPNTLSTARWANRIVLSGPALEASDTPIVPVQRSPFVLTRPNVSLLRRWIEA